MKKLGQILALLLALLLLVTACGTTPDNPTATNTQSSEATTSAPNLGPTVEPTMPAVEQPEAPAANTAAALNYVLKEGGTYVFVNGPEGLKRKDLGDSGTSLFAGTFDGSLHLYYEHNNETGGAIYYGIYFYNDTATDAVFSLQNHGASFGWTKNCESWDLYYNYDGVAQEIPVKANSGQWLFFTIDESLANHANGARTHSTTFDPTLCSISTTTFDGIIRGVSSGPMEVYVVAFDTGNVESIDPRALTYPDSDWKTGCTGYSPYLGEVEAIVSWTIDDNTPYGNLPVSVKGTTQDLWFTNSTSKASNVVGHDNVPLTIPFDGGEAVLTYDKNDIRKGSEWEWANWGMLYQHQFYITNNSSKAQTVAYYMVRSAGNNHYMGTYSPLNSPAYKSLPFSDINNWLDTDQKVVEVVIQPGETVCMPVEIVLGGQSGGHVGHYVKVMEPLTFMPEDNKVFVALEGYDEVKAHTVEVLNTSGGGLEALTLTLTGANADVFKLSSDTLPAMSYGISRNFSVAPVDGLGLGNYEANVTISDAAGTVLGVFPLVLTVSTLETCDYLTLVPITSWESSTGDSQAVVSYGAENADGVPSLIFTNTAGNWPATTGALAWGTGLKIDRDMWDDMILYFDVEVQYHANITLLSGGPSLAEHRIPLSKPMYEYNTLDEGGIDSGSLDLQAGHYVGSVSLSDIMDLRIEANGSSMAEVENFYMDGWRVFPVGNAPAEVKVNVLKLVYEG